MSLEHIRAKRRVVRVALAAGLAAALSATGPATASAAPGSDGDPAAAPPKASADKLGHTDADLLARAEASGEKHVTMMIATTPGSTEQVAGQLGSVPGASVGRTYDKLGYVRATVPTGKASAAIDRAVKLSSVYGVDLSEEVELPDPRPAADTGGSAEKSVTGGTRYTGPGPRTPAKNPYQPSFETGAVDFVRDNPKADGRGITIGILDSGVDLGHPALQRTTTGERKIVDWVTATDPLTEGDATWRPMITAVSGPEFGYSGRTWTAPAGSYQVSTFKENATLGGEMEGDLNRDGDTTDVWGVLYDAKAGTVRVDLDGNGDFGDDTVMKPYKEDHQVGHFGTDDPDTDIAERIPFVVEIREDVPMDPAGDAWGGKKADFVNIGVVEGAHGSHVAGITAAHGLFGGRMDGAAPGAQIVSSRACTWSGGCTNVALTEGMIDLVVNRGVDIVNMSIGGLPALNDGNNARAELYNRLIDEYGVQLVISAGNSGPGANTIGDPALAAKVISVGATASKETWAANYGSAVTKAQDVMPFSSRGPREDGGFTPTISAPGASVNTVPTWQAGQPVKEAGYTLPAGYGMLQGTSMASPQAAGAAALLLSKAEREDVELTPAKLRTALSSTAYRIPGVQAYVQGSGLLDVGEAWELVEDGVDAHEYTVEAPVDTAIDQSLKTPGVGTGLYDREGGLKTGQKRTYDITVTRTTGPSRAVRHKLRWENNDGTFKLTGPSTVQLALGEPVTVKVVAKARTTGVHSGILTVDDRRTGGVDHKILATVVAAEALPKPSHAFTADGSVQRNSTTSYFITVPEGATSLEIAMSGLKPGSQTRFIALHPYGVPVDPTSTVNCYPDYTNPANTCRPDVRSYPDPTPGVWEVEVESRRTSPLPANPYTITGKVFGATFDPAVRTVDEAEVGTATPVEWTVDNRFAPIRGSLRGGPLGSARTERPTLGDHGSRTTTVVLGEGVDRLDVAIGNTSDASADLDLSVYLGGVRVGQSADGDSEESVSITSPAAGAYTVVVDGYSIPAGSTAFDYKDVYFTSELGEVRVGDTRAVELGHGASTEFSAEVLVNGAAPEGRRFFGQVQLVNDRGTVAGLGSVLIDKVVS